MNGDAARKSLKKNVGFLTNDNFLGFFFKNRSAFYDGDLTGFCQPFTKVIFKTWTSGTHNEKYL